MTSSRCVPRSPVTLPAAIIEGDAVVGLARAACAGDRTAFAQLHARFARAVRALLLAHAPLREVDDLLQETFLQAWRARAALREPERFGAWLFAISRSLAGRARKAMPRESLPESLAAPGAELHAQLAAEGAEALSALRALPEAYRETLALRLIEGLSGPEIAAATGLTHGSVRVNLHRGMELLRERLRGGVHQ